MRLGIFGGTFNPPHLGHLRLIIEMADKMQLDRVLIIPASIPPHKQAPNLASGKDRLEMCRLCFGSDSRFVISDMELLRVGKSYTYDTLCEIRAEYPDAELFLVVGSDMLQSFEKWYRYHDILMMSTLCAASREDGFVPVIEGKFTPEESAKIKFISIPVFPLSSTQIRQKVSSGEDTHGLLNKEVRDYIDEKGLYL